MCSGPTESPGLRPISCHPVMSLARPRMCPVLQQPADARHRGPSPRRARRPGSEVWSLRNQDRLHISRYPRVCHPGQQSSEPLGQTAAQGLRENRGPELRPGLVPSRVKGKGRLAFLQSSAAKNVGQEVRVLAALLGFFPSILFFDTVYPCVARDSHTHDDPPASAS